MHKVYVIMLYDYSNTNIVGVFSSRAKAEEFCSKADSGYAWTIVEQQLDPEQDKDEPIKSYWFNTFYLDCQSKGMRLRDEVIRQLVPKNTTPISCFCELFWEGMKVYVPDDIPLDRAKKIATDKGIEYLRLLSIGFQSDEITALLNREKE